MAKKPLNVVIITPPTGNAGIVPLSHLVKIMSNISKSVSVITGNVDVKSSNIQSSNVSVYNIFYSVKSNPISKILNHIRLQVMISHKLLILRNTADILVYFLDSHAYFLPVFFGRLLRKRVVFLLAASISDSVISKSSNIERILVLSERINFKLADRIVVYSPSLIEKWKLNKYSCKTLIAHRHFLDFNAYTAFTPLSDRSPLIGYIGRLSGEKGVQHFAQALPAILCDQRDLRVFIGGDGRLKEAIEVSLQKEGLLTRVDLPGWLSRNDLPNYLNQLRLLVLPSYTEGLPNIMLEAMACGTPVLATPVGAIPDVIIDGKTGFIMENNSPECIAENVIRALNSPELEQIAENGKHFVEEKFTFERAVDRWDKVLEEIR